MKKLLLMAMALLTAGFFSCKKDTNITNSVASVSLKSRLTASYTEKQVDNPPIPVSWQIKSLIVNGKDLTWYIADYNFLFYTNGTVIASDKTSTYYGKWNLNSSKELYFDFQAPNPPVESENDLLVNRPDIVFVLGNLNGVWTVREMSFNRIVLEIRTKTDVREVWFYNS